MSFVIGLRGLLCTRTSPGGKIPGLLDRRGRHATIVTCQSLPVTHGEVYASGVLEGYMGLLGAVWDRARACFAERMAA